MFYTERERENISTGGHSSLSLSLLLFGLPVALDDLLTPAVSCIAVVNLSKHQREGKRERVLYNTTRLWWLQLLLEKGGKTIPHPFFFPPNEQQQQQGSESDTTSIDLDELHPSSLSSSALPLLAPPSLPPSVPPSLSNPLAPSPRPLLSSRLWMPSSLTVWIREGKEERVGWRTSGRNGRTSLSFFFFFIGMQQHGCV